MLCSTRATAAAAAAADGGGGGGGGVNQNPCYDAALNALFLYVYLQLCDN
jgi:hypothetical protein